MKARDILTVLNVASLTALITLAIILPSSVSAGPDGSPLAKTIQSPALVVNDVEITLNAAEGRALKEGEQPTLLLRAVNTSDSKAEITFETAMTALSRPATARGAIVSRMPPLPRAIWQQKHTLTLGPREEKAITLSANITLPSNSQISAILSESGTRNSIVAFSFSTAMVLE